MRITKLTIMGDSGREYEIGVAERDGSLWCSCPAWKNTRQRAANERLCKHLVFATRELAEHFSRATS